MPVITCIDDLKQLYRRRTPRMFYDYAESGSYTEGTFRANSDDFQRIKLRQKVAVDMTGRTTESTMIGEKVAMPVAARSRASSSTRYWSAFVASWRSSSSSAS